MSSRIPSGDINVFISGSNIKGVQSASVSGDLDAVEIGGFASLSNLDINVLKTKQTFSASVTFLHGQYNSFMASPVLPAMAGFNGDVEIVSRLNGSIKIENCYLISAELSVDVEGSLVSTLTFEGDKLINGDSSFTRFDEKLTTNEGNVSVLLGSQVGVVSEICATSLSVKFDLPRKPIMAYGGGTVIRIAETPIKDGTITLTGNMEDAIGLFSVNAGIKEANEADISIGGLYTFNNCRYISLSESADINGTLTGTLTLSVPINDTTP